MRTCEINGELVLIEPTWRVSDKINTRTTLSATVVDLGALTDIIAGDAIVLQDDGTKLFAGTIDNVEDYEAMPGKLFYSISAVDNTALADKRTIATSVVNKTAGEIINEHILPALADEGVTAGDIDSGAEITKAVFNYDAASVALDYIRDVTGYNWNIDFDRQLQFFRRDKNYSPYELTDSTQHSNFRRSRTRGQYRNRQYVRAGKGKTSLQELERPTPQPDGVSRNFIVRFPLAEKPKIFVNSVEINESGIGVNGLDNDKRFYFSFDSNVITQADTETVLDNSDTVEVTYTGLFPILVVADNPDEIVDRAAKETDTSGIYETLTQETSINESSQALEFAQGLLQKYGKIPSTVSFQTQQAGLKAGQLLKVIKPLYGINDYFLIESVDTAVSRNQLIFNVKCLDGATLGGWETFFKDLLKGGKIAVIQENEVLVLLNTQQETEGAFGETKIERVAAIYPSATLYPSVTLYPGNKISEVTINDRD